MNANEVIDCSGTETDYRKAFVHKFKTDNGFYIYDVNRNTVVNVGSTEYLIIDDFGRLSQDQVIAKYSAVCEPDALRQAWQRLADAHRANGLFSSNRPKRIALPLDETTLRQLCEERTESITLCLTEQCNLRCLYCPYSSPEQIFRAHSDRSMSWDVARKALEYLKKRSKYSDRVHVGFYGGEPLLQLNLLKQCLEYGRALFRSKPLTFGLTTNGTCLTKTARALLAKNQVMLTISLDGPKQIHDRYRRTVMGSGTFENVQRNLEAFQAEHPDYYQSQVTFNLVLAPPYDYQVIDTFLKQSPTIRENRVRPTFVATEGTNFLDQFTPQELAKKCFLDSIDSCLKTIETGEITPVSLLKDKLKSGLFSPEIETLGIHLAETLPFPYATHPGVCYPGLHKLFISVEGKFFICEKVNSASDLLCIGDVETGVNVSKAIQLMQDYSMTHDGCRDCYAIRHCGLCYVHAAGSEKFEPTKKLQSCGHRRSNLHETLVRLMKIYESNPSYLGYLKQMVIR